MNFDFDEYIRHSNSRLEYRSREPEFIKKHILVINQKVQDLKKQNPELSFADLKQIFNNNYEELLDTMFESSDLFDYVTEYESSLFFQKHREELLHKLEVYKKHPESFATEYYLTHPKSNLRCFVRYFKSRYDSFMNQEIFQCPAIKEVNKFLDDETKTPSEKKKFLNSVSSSLSFGTKQFFKKYVDCYTGKETAYIGYDQEEIKDNLVDALARSLSMIGNSLDKHGFLEQYPLMQERNLVRKVDPTLKDFVHPFNSTKDKLGLDRLKSYEYLSTLPLESLLGLNCSWYNRFIKEFDTYSESMFVIDSLGLLPQMLNGTLSDEDLDIQKISRLYEKMEFLYIPANNYWSKVSKAKRSDEEKKNSDPNKKYYFINNENLTQAFDEDFINKYNSYFSDINPNIEHDMDLYWKLFTPIFNGYSIKDSAILSTITLSSALGKPINYGIAESDRIFEGVLPFNYKLNFWMDFKGLNFPVREHIQLNVLTDFLKYYKEDTKVPFYFDKNAFDGIQSHIIFPLNKPMTKILKDGKNDKFSKFSPKATNMLKHLAFTSSSKYSIKDEDRIYVDLETFQFYKKQFDDDKKPIYTEIENYSLEEFQF